MAKFFLDKIVWSYDSTKEKSGKKAYKACVQQFAGESECFPRDSLAILRKETRRSTFLPEEKINSSN